MGRFLPHPDDIPVEIPLRNQPSLPRQKLHSISLGGVACNSDRSWRCGTAVDMSMPTLGENARYPGYIAWCEKHPAGYRIGVALIDEQTLFGARMGEQVCQIERYCRLHEDAEPTPAQLEAMARDWVSRHAGEFSHEAVVQPALD